MGGGRRGRTVDSGCSNLSAETIQSTTLSLQGVYNIQGCDCLPLGVLCVGDCVADDAFKEGLEDTAGFFVDH